MNARAATLACVAACFALGVGIAWFLRESDPPSTAPAPADAKRPTAALRPTPDPAAVTSTKTEIVATPESASSAAPNAPARLEGKVVLPDGSPAIGFSVSVRYPAPLVSPMWVANTSAPRKKIKRNAQQAATETASIMQRVAALDEEFGREVTVSASTDEHGDFCFVGLRAPALVACSVGVPSGSALLPFELRDVRLAPDTLTKLPVIRLSTGGRIEGYVVDSFDQPLANAKVWTSSGKTTTTNGSGQFAFDGLRDGIELLEASHAEGLESLGCGARIHAVPGKTESARIVLPRATHVTGRVIGSDGRGIEGARVIARFEAIGANGRIVLPVTGTSATDGEFDICGIRAGAPCTLIAEKPGYTTLVELTETAGATGLLLKLARLPRVIVHCVDLMNRTAIEPDGIDTDAIDLFKIGLFQVAIEDFRVGPGQFAIPAGSAPGRQRLLVAHKAGWPDVTKEITTGTVDVGPIELEFTPPAVIGVDGVVIDGATGRPIERASIDVFDAHVVPDAKVAARADADGRFHLMLTLDDANNLAMDPHEPTKRLGLQVRADAYVKEDVSQFIGKPILMFLGRAEPHFGGAVFGAVIGRDGRPAAGLALVCDGQTTMTDERGTYRFDGLAPLSPKQVIPNDPKYTVEPLVTDRLRGIAQRLFHQGEGDSEILPPRLPAPFEWRFDVTETEPVVKRDIDLRPHTGSLRGTVFVNSAPAIDVDVAIVFGADLRPFADPGETIEERVAPELRTRTSADGSFAFPLLLPLEARVRATRNGRRVANPVAVRVEYGADATVEIVGTIADLRGVVRGIAPQSEDLPIVTIHRVDDRSGFRDSVMTAADGSFAFLEVQGGKYELLARNLERTSRLYDVEVTANGSQSVFVDLEPTHRVVLSEALQKAMTPDSAALVIGKKRTIPLDFGPDLSGRLVVGYLPAGKHTLRFFVDVKRSSGTVRDFTDRTIEIPAGSKEFVIE